MTANRHVLRGACHCGSLDVAFTTSTAPEALPLRACQCSFCRRHGAITTSDPAGRLRIVARDETAWKPYVFGQRTAELAVCSRCGVYVAALLRRAPPRSPASGGGASSSMQS
jgi:hypothetical protein